LHDIAKEVGLNPIKDDENGIRLDTSEVLEDFFNTIIEHCKNGETVRIKNFGTFKARVYKGRTLKSPLLEDGEITFGDQLVLRFHQSLVAKRRLNDGYVPEGEKPKKAAAKKGKKTAKKGKKAKKAS
jgi:nucleoid DNA-binding protein